MAVGMLFRCGVSTLSRYGTQIAQSVGVSLGALRFSNGGLATLAHNAIRTSNLRATLQHETAQNRQSSSLVTGWKVDSAIHGPVGSTVCRTLLRTHQRLGPVFIQPSRTHIKFSWKKGRQKTVYAVVKRFYRLHWGAWIRTKPGRHKRLYKKSWKRRSRLRRHIFCNRTQNQLLDHMVTKFWKRPMYFVDDPYEPYQVRHGVFRRSPTNPIT